uniref:Uncharacterized protein n=1 Tax=Rhizophora mucronata TaxID=61149 RepID=A0A2P2N035_RHIMU
MLQIPPCFRLSNLVKEN